MSADAARITRHFRSTDDVRRTHAIDGPASPPRHHGETRAAFTIGQRVTVRGGRSILLGAEAVVMSTQGGVAGYILCRAIVNGKTLSGWSHRSDLEIVEV